MKTIKIPNIKRIKIQVENSDNPEIIDFETVISEVTVEQIYQSIDELIAIVTSDEPINLRLRKASSLMLRLSTDLSAENFEKAHGAFVDAMITGFSEVNKGFLQISSRLGLTRMLAKIRAEAEAAISDTINPKRLHEQSQQ